MNYLYDGSGNRVAMMATVNGTTTLTAYIGNIEEVQTTGSSTQTTTYYAVGSMRIAAKVNTTLYYFGYDALGSQTLVLNSNGSVVGSQLYGSYGNQRYSSGTLPTSIGFTGQRADSVTGLDYYVARYYDPAVGVFLSPDSVQGNAQGMQPYAYVGGNPESRTDPTGQRFACPDCGGGGSDSGGGGGGSGGMPVCNSTTCNDGSGHTESNPTRHWHPVPPPPPSTPLAAPNAPPPPTPTPEVNNDGFNDTCHMAADKCNQAENNRAKQNQDLQNSIGNLQIAMSVANLLLDGLHVWKDFAGGWNFDTIARVIGDAVSLIGDIATLFSGIASRFNLSWLKPIADVIGGIASGVGGLYRAATGSPWGMGALITIFYTIKATFVEGDVAIEAENAMFSVIQDMTHFDALTAGASAITGLIQAGIDGYQYRIDSNNNSSLDNFCPC